MIYGGKLGLIIVYVVYLITLHYCKFQHMHFAILQIRLDDCRLDMQKLKVTRLTVARRDADFPLSNR